MARQAKKDRVGDVLGLGSVTGSSDPHEHGRPRESDAEHRHHRMSEGADEITPAPTTPERHSGATGIDMGAGGAGTDVTEK